MNGSVLRGRILLALGAPIASGCNDPPPPRTPAPVDVDLAAAPAASLVAPAPSAVAAGDATCKQDEIHEGFCGLITQAPRGGPPMFTSCGSSARELEWIDPSTRSIEAGTFRTDNPDLDKFSFDLQASREALAKHASSQKMDPCCYARCVPLKVTAAPRKGVPKGLFARQTCMPAPMTGTTAPASKAPNCPAGVELPIKDGQDNARKDLAPLVSGTPTECCYQSLATQPGCKSYEHESESGVCLQIMRGRALRERGAIVVAPSRRRVDWQDHVDPIIDGAPTPRALAAAAWAREGAAEHASVASFARLSLELMIVGAPADLVDAAHVAARDEIRHTTLAYGLASAFAGAPVGPGPLPITAAHQATDLLALADACFVDGCVGETLAALEAAAARDLARPSAVRAALDGIADDEARHAELAYRILAWALAEGGAAVRDRIEARLAEVEHHADVVRAEEPAGFDEGLGVLRRSSAARLRASAIREVVVPCTRALLGGDSG